MDIPFARKVLEHCRAHPDEFNMANWVVRKAPNLDDYESEGTYLEQLNHWGNTSSLVDLTQPVSCGTRACIAGTAVLLDPNPNLAFLDGESEVVRFKDGSEEELVAYAANLLGLDYETAYELFHETVSDEYALTCLENLITKAEEMAK